MRDAENFYRIWMRAFCGKQVIFIENKSKKGKKSWPKRAVGIPTATSSPEAHWPNGQKLDFFFEWVVEINIFGKSSSCVSWLI